MTFFKCIGTGLMVMMSGLALGFLRAPSGTELIRRAASWIEAESQWTDRYNYLTGGEVRLLLFWKGEDDAGRGYIRLGHRESEPGDETLTLLFGSIPERAPLDLNRWGAATEVLRRAPESGEPVASAFLGFRIASAEAEAAESRPQSEDDTSAFEASLNYVSIDDAVARLLFVNPGETLDLSGMERVRQQALADFEDVDSSIRRLEASERSCSSVTGFLFTMKSILEEIAAGRTPSSRCYVYNAREYTVRVTDTEKIDSREVTLELESGGEKTRRYRDLVRVELETLNHDTHNTTSFTVVTGTRGALSGIPVEIVYQPSAWVRIRIQLKDEET